MALHKIESEKWPEGFPDETWLRVEAVSGQNEIRHRVPKGSPPGTKRPVEIMFRSRDVVWEGPISGEWAHNLDQGKYAWSAWGKDEEGIYGWKEVGFFLVGLTEDQWMWVTNQPIDQVKAVMTTMGTLWTCLWPGCRKRLTSKIAAVLHEQQRHRGADLLAVASKSAAARKKHEDGRGKGVRKVAVN